MDSSRLGARCSLGHDATTAAPFSLGGSKSTTDKLQRVLNAAAGVVSDTRKYDRGLSHLLHDELHWLDVPQRVQYKLYATVHRCLQHKAPQYTFLFFVFLAYTEH